MSQGGGLVWFNPASLVSTSVPFAYIVALLFGIVKNFIFNLYNDPLVTNFIIVNIEDYLPPTSYIYTIRLTRRLLGIRILLFLVRT